jgi:hypothetical protein
MSTVQQPTAAEHSADDHAWLEDGFLTTVKAGRMLRVSPKPSGRGATPDSCAR